MTMVQSGSTTSRDLTRRTVPPEVSSSEAVKAYYSTWWENAKDIRASVFQRRNRKVADRIAEIGGTKALDLGSGKGAVVKMLRRRGFAVTAVEFNSEFASAIRTAYPEVEVLCEDVRVWSPTHNYDVATCIELAQVLSHEELLTLLRNVRPFTKRLIVSISNANSFHGRWVRLRRFQAPFIVEYTPRILRDIVRRAGYRLLHEEGVGMLTPVSLLKDFRMVVVSTRVADIFSKLDRLLPRQCHLYLVDAIPETAGRVLR